MEPISRRKFLQQAGTGAAAAGAVSAFGIPHLTARPKKSTAAVHQAGVAAPDGRASDGPLVVHIPDPRSGQVHFMFGTSEVVTHDPALVAKLVHSAH